MIPRSMLPFALELAGKYPVLTILGPRQSGKTTLARTAFPEKPYVNLEHPVTREFAETDPVAFLASYPDGAIFDEIQRVPHLLSYIQVIVDEKNAVGMYILTGSHQFDLRSSINQSLAGRTAILKLLPFSMAELTAYGEHSADELLFKGFYPRVHERNINPTQAYGDYLETYIERDLRQIIAIRDLSTFQKFLRLLAGRIGQLLNYANLANDAGVSQSTAKEWVSILEASFVCFQLQSWQPSIRKRLVKSPKLYFCDVGLSAMLLGIEHQTQIATHPLRGNLYENLVVVDLLKYRYNRGLRNNLLFYRDSNGNEVDVLYSIADAMLPIEIKSGQTISSDYLKGITHFESTIGNVPYGSMVVYNGPTEQKRGNCRIVNEKNCVSVLQELGV